eukprot:2834604-Amphidinium_carterae.1
MDCPGALLLVPRPLWRPLTHHTSTAIQGGSGSRQSATTLQPFLVLPTSRLLNAKHKCLLGVAHADSLAWSEKTATMNPPLPSRVTPKQSELLV